MSKGEMHSVLRHIRQMVGKTELGNRSDGQLLHQFISRRDEAAFAALVQRHGPMVLGVCRRLLRNSYDAEDAFQATFLLLVRNARSIARPESVSSWLYGVAFKIAVRARGRRQAPRNSPKAFGKFPGPGYRESYPFRIGEGPGSGIAAFAAEVSRSHGSPLPGR
jgi:hypothetical protein